jgi:hypothetical protein
LVAWRAESRPGRAGFGLYARALAEFAPLPTGLGAGLADLRAVPAGARFLASFRVADGVSRGFGAAWCAQMYHRVKRKAAIT